MVPVDAEESGLRTKVPFNSSRFTSRDGVDNNVDPVSSLKPDKMTLTLFERNRFAVKIWFSLEHYTVKRGRENEL